jgi:GNAT superfamily N-acetyltransferase
MPQSAATAQPSIPSIAARHTAFRVGSGAILLSEYNRSLMSDQFVLRLAQLSDFAFCQRLYFEGMGSIIETLKLDMARQRESFGQQWRLAEVRIIAVAGNDVGWMQTTPANDAIFLGQLYLEGRFQRQGIGSRVIRAVIDEATRQRKAVTLGVVKINPARPLYKRLGFSVTHEDQYKVYMRREPDRMPA